MWFGLGLSCQACTDFSDPGFSAPLAAKFYFLSKILHSGHDAASSTNSLRDNPES